MVDKLGLESGSQYIAFDFWSQKLLGVFTDQIKIEIEPHDTRVLSIHPVLRRPQLIGNSRHITGAYSISDQEWDGAKNRLSGSSESLPGETYTLWFYVPKGVAVTRLGLVTKGGSAIPARHVLADNLLTVSFQGQPEPVRWELSFSGGA
jgi:hypothetical protein